MNTKIKIGVAAALVVVIGVVFFSTRSTSPQDVAEVIIPETDPMDTVLDFYNGWLDIVTGTSTDPLSSELVTSAVLSDEVRDAVRDAQSNNPELDPITCQTQAVPERFRGRIFPVSASEFQILVESRVDQETLPYMAFVTVEAVAGAWQITDIKCTQGDIAPEVEFNYNREGLLLKTVPPPFTAGQWHLVFEQDGQMGHVTPLFFSPTTTCVNTNGEETICNPDTFAETTKVRVKGGMTEVGAEVQQVEFLE